MPTFVIRNGELVEKSSASNNDAPSASNNDAPNVISDSMPPTRHMANGLTYESKSLFRQATRDAGCVEIGNENVIQPRKPVQLDRRQRREDIRRAISDLRDGRAPTIRHILEANKE